MSTQWFYNLDGQNHGPIDSSHLRALAADGTITTDTLIWKNGMNDWVPANKVKDLFPSTPPPSMPITEGPPPLPKSRAAVNRGSNETVVAAKQMAVDVAADIRRKFHVQRIAIIAAASFGILATFLPWVSLPILGTIYGTAGDGWITLCLFIPAVVLAFRGDRLAPLTGGVRLGAAIPAGIAGLIGLAKIVQFKSKMAEAGDDNPFAAALSSAVQLRFGIFALVIAGIAVCLAAWLLEKREQVSVND